jgi:hypothetical protein
MAASALATSGSGAEIQLQILKFVRIGDFRGTLTSLCKYV